MNQSILIEGLVCNKKIPEVVLQPGFWNIVLC